MKKLSAFLTFSLITVYSNQAFAHSYTKLCETIPADAKQGSFIATDDVKNPNYVKVGDTESFIEGRNNRYLVNQHNGQPIVYSESCEGKMIAEKGPKLKGLLITTPEFYRNQMHSSFSSPGFYVKNLPILTDDAFINDHLQNYKDQTVNDDLLNDIIRDTVVFMRDKNQPVVDVYFPEQDITDGFIVALISRAVIGKVILNGNEYYSDEEIARFITAEPGQYIWSDDISKDLRWINSYPYRQTDLIFKPGEKPKTTDLIFETKDMYPFRIFGGVDNYGTKATGINQFYAGFSYGDLWDLDHELIYSFGSSFNVSNFNSHTLQYIIPIPSLRDKLSFTGNYSTSEPKSSTPLIKQNGTNVTINIDYEMPLYDYGLRGFTQSLRLGADWKKLENDIEFGGINVFNSAPEIAQFYVTYEGAKTSANTLNSYSATVVSSPGSITDGNDDTKFDAARTGADPEYTYGKGTYKTSYTEPNSRLTFAGLFRGQVSNEKLLSSEQMSISGPGSVRGFGSNTVRRDGGFISTIEVSSPYIPVIDELLSSVVRDRLQGFVFYDRGHGYDVSTSGDGVNLDSYGIGTRFGIGNNMNGEVVYGREAHDEFKDGHDQRVDFRVNAAY